MEVAAMLWFGLRKRLGAALRRLRELEDRVKELERTADPVRIRASLLEGAAAIGNATDKLNRVVERRRNQLDYEDDGTDEDDFYDLLAQRRGASLPDDDSEPEDDDDAGDSGSPHA